MEIEMIHNGHLEVLHVYNSSIVIRLDRTMSTSDTTAGPHTGDITVSIY